MLKKYLDVAGVVLSCAAVVLWGALLFVSVSAKRNLTGADLVKPVVRYQAVNTTGNVFVVDRVETAAGDIGYVVEWQGKDGFTYRDFAIGVKRIR